MKQILFITALIAGLTMSACTKTEDPEIAPKAPAEQRLIAVSHAVYGTDSITYSNDRISLISMYKNVNGYLRLENRYRLDYGTDQIKVYNVRGTTETECISIRMSQDRITSISGLDGQLNAYFVYNGDKLKYFVYNRYDIYALRTASKDSVYVSHDKAGSNISTLNWYSHNYISNFETTYQSEYSFDDKKSPYCNSIYFLIKNWQGPDDVISYFNQNNIVLLNSHNFTYYYDENEYPVFQDISVYGRTSFYYEAK